MVESRILNESLSCICFCQDVYCNVRLVPFAKATIYFQFSLSLSLTNKHSLDAGDKEGSLAFSMHCCIHYCTYTQYAFLL